MVNLLHFLIFNFKRVSLQWKIKIRHSQTSTLGNKKMQDWIFQVCILSASLCLFSILAACHSLSVHWHFYLPQSVTFSKVVNLAFVSNSRLNYWSAVHTATIFIGQLYTQLQFCGHDYSFPFALPCESCWILVPDQESSPCPRKWKSGILTAGLPEKPSPTIITAFYRG